MIQKKVLLPAAILFLTIAGIFFFVRKRPIDDRRFVSHIIDVKKQDIKFYWKDDKNKNFSSIENLKLWLEKHKRKLVFAMNGGMYKPDHSPQGLYIENEKPLSPLDTSDGSGNFYLKPNGVFYITTGNIPVICPTATFRDNGKIKWATQSGPMLVVDGRMHPAFKENSANLNVRNGVGILPGNKVVFAMSKNEISFFEFANYFKSLGCSNALYLDGLVSRTYMPEKNWIQTDGNFGVIIGVTTSL